MNEAPTDSRDGAGRYEIRIRGHLASRWSDWFGGFTLTRLDDGTTTLAGFVVDQAALHGVLRIVADLGLPLLSVTPAAPDEPSDATSTDPC
jgi:hypothetical protein